MPYTPEIGFEICESLAEGQSLLSIAKRMSLKESTIRYWVAENPEFAANYARARETGDDVEFDRLIDMASEDPPVVEGRVDAGWVTWKRNQLDQYKWNLARKRPKKYGDKIQNEHSGKLTLESLVTGSYDSITGIAGTSDVS